MTPAESPKPRTVVGLGQTLLQICADGRRDTLTLSVRCLVRPDLNPPALYMCLTPEELIDLIEQADGHPWEIAWKRPIQITPEDSYDPC